MLTVVSASSPAHAVVHGHGVRSLQSQGTVTVTVPKSCYSLLSSLLSQSITNNRYEQAIFTGMSGGSSFKWMYILVYFIMCIFKRVYIYIYIYI